MSIVTLPEAKAELGIPASYTDDDAELQDRIDGIGRAVENYKHEVIEERPVTDELDLPSGTTRFRVWSTPVIDLVSVQTVDGATTWDVTGLHGSKTSGLVRVLSGAAVGGLVEVTYTAGYEQVPEHYKRGALVILAHVWETQRGVGSVRAGIVGDEEVYDPRFSYSVPRKALEWLGAPQPVIA